MRAPFVVGPVAVCHGLARSRCVELVVGELDDRVLRDRALLDRVLVVRVPGGARS